MPGATKWIVHVFRVIWIIFIFNNEFIVFLSSARQCALNNTLISNNKILLIADPQITDDMSYKQPAMLMSVIKFYSALYMKRNYKHLLAKINPNEIFFLGDLMDNGREWDDTKYELEVDKFYSIFNSEKEKHHYMIGNHDMGFSQGPQLQLRNRFESYFGNTSYVYQYNGYSIIVLDTISLSSNDPNLRNSIAANSILNGELPSTPRILFTHVPLYRDPEQSCGPNRQKLNTIIPNQYGYQYQNLLSPELSNQILDKINPIAIFSGDDHDFCKVTHTYDNNKKVVEMTVPTFSMAQGLKEPGVMILDVSNTTLLKTELCWLPNQILIFIQYAYLLIFTLIVLFTWHIMTRRGGYSPLAKEELGEYHTNNNMKRTSCIMPFFYSIKDIAMIGIPTYILCILIF